MKMYIYLLILSLSVLIPIKSIAGCADIPEKLYMIKMGGPRNYLDQLPTGLSLSPVKLNWQFAGRDIIVGSTHNMQLIKATIDWYKGNVAIILSTIKADSKEILDEYLEQISKLADLKFIFDPRSELYQLKCNDGLSVTAGKTSIYGGSDKPAIPVLTLSIIHPLYNEMLKEIKNQK